VSTVKKITVKKPAAKKTAAKKAPAGKKAVIKKTAAKKAPAVKKSAIKRSAPAVKSTGSKAPAAAKSAPKKAFAAKTAVKKVSAAEKETNPVISLGRECLTFIAEKKGEKAVFLDLREVNSYLDYFIICTANSKIHCRALAKDIEQFYLEKGQKPRCRPDYDSEWVILDYYGLIIHIFTEEVRAYYDLDRLWADAARL
jgi:ribosome-associated protein